MAESESGFSACASWSWRQVTLIGTESLGQAELTASFTALLNIYFEFFLILVSPCIFHNSLFIKHPRNALHFTTLLYFNGPLHMFRFMQKPSSGGVQNYIHLHTMIFLSLLLCNILVFNCHPLIKSVLNKIVENSNKFSTILYLMRLYTFFF